MQSPNFSCSCGTLPVTTFFLTQINVKTMVYNQNFSYWGESVFPLVLLSVLTVENFHGVVSKQDFKVYPLPLVNYKISTFLPLSALLVSRIVLEETAFPTAIALSLGSLHLYEEDYYFALQVASF